MYTKKIKTKKRGNSLGIAFFKISLHIFGLRGTYGFLYFVCLYYLIFDKKLLKTTLSYVDKMFPFHFFVRKYIDVYFIFINQGKQLIDRYAFIHKKTKFNIKLKGYDNLKKILKNSNNGALFLTSHVGNWQLTLASLKDLKKKVYLLMRQEDNKAVKDSLKIDIEDNNIKIISPEGFLGGVVDIINVLKENNIVSIMGDRRYVFKSIEVNFLKEKAYFPYGAFNIAYSVKCPIIILLSGKDTTYGYTLDMANVIYTNRESNISKNSQIKIWVQDFVNILEKHIKQYPYQCFLFDNVWKNQYKK